MNTESPVALPIAVGPRAPGYWIRRYVPEKDMFVLAAVDGESPEFLAAIDPQSPSRGRTRETILAALFGQRPALAPVRLLVQDRSRERRKGDGAKSEKILTITDAFQTRSFIDADARKLLDGEGRVISRWSEGLEDAVDHHGRIWLAQGALEFFTELDVARFDEIRHRAAARLPSEATALLPSSFSAMLRGGERERPCRYNPNLPLSLQLGRAPTNEERANYALQRAVVVAFAENTSADRSLLEQAQAALLESRALLAVPAARSAALLHAQTIEAGRGIAAQLLAGLMELNGASAATQEFDELWTPKADGSFARRPALHDEILREIAAHPVGESTDLDEKTRAYLAIGRARLTRYEAEARQLVAAEQTKSAIAVKAPTTDLPLEPLERELVPGQTPRAAKRFKKAARPIAGALEQAHKLATEAEAVPWF